MDITLTDEGQILEVGWGMLGGEGRSLTEAAPKKERKKKKKKKERSCVCAGAFDHQENPPVSNFL